MNDFTKMILTMTAPVNQLEQGVSADRLYENRCWDLVTHIHGRLPVGKFMEWPRNLIWPIEMRCYRVDPNLLTRDWRLFRHTVQRILQTCNMRRPDDSVFWSEVQVNFYHIYMHRLSALFLSDRWQKWDYWSFVESVCVLQDVLDQLCAFILQWQVTTDVWRIYRSSLSARTTQCMAELMAVPDRLVRGELSYLAPQFKIRKLIIEDFKRFIYKRFTMDEEESDLFQQYVRSEEVCYDSCFQRGLYLARNLGATPEQYTLFGLAVHHYRDRVLALYQHAIKSLF